MHSPESQAELERVVERNQWVVAWVSCFAATSVGLAQIVLDWGRRTTIGKMAAISFLAFLFLVPVTVLVRRKRGKQVMAGWTLALGYILLMLALQAFGPAAHMR
jgi:hypothetical protein